MARDSIGYVQIDWRPDKSLNTSLSRQIISYILDKISKGDWVLGDRLPPQRELAGVFGVNRSTVVDALSELTALGIIEANYGSGTRICNTTWSLMAAAGPPNWRSYISSGIHYPNVPTVQKINKIEYEKDIIRLSTGELSPELMPRDILKETFYSLGDRDISLNYLEPLGLLELRQALSRHLKTIGLDAPPSCILIVSGSLQALHLISIGILKPNSTVFTESLSYLRSLNIFQSAKMHIAEVPMDKNGPHPASMDRSKIAKGTSLLYTIPTFHNPTGIVMPEARRRELMDWCSLNTLPVIEDDVYRDLWFDKEPPPPLKTLDHNGSVLYLGSTSKSLAPGFRLGWLVGPEAVIEHLGDIKMQIDYGANSISQWAFTELLESGAYDRHLAQLRVKLKERRDYVLNLLNEHFKDIAEWNTPEGGFYILLKILPKISTSTLFDQAAAKGILVNPGSIYSDTENRFLRISYSFAEKDQLEKGLIILSKLIRGLAGI